MVDLASNSENSPVPTPVEAKRRLGVVRQCIASLILTISYLIIGTSLGWTSPILYNMHKTGEPINMTVTETSLMVSLFYVGNIVMPIPCGLLTDAFGRRSTMLLMSVFPLLSWILIYFATHPVFLHTAKLLVGFWGGSVRTVIPLYLGEIAEPRIRGSLSVLSTIQANIGILLAYIIGPLVSYWTLAIFGGCIPVIFLLTFWLVPESPYWLISKNDDRKAAKSIVWLRGLKNTDDAKDEVAHLTASIEYDRQQPKGFLMLFKSKNNRKAFMIVEVIAITQRLSGIGALVVFSSTTLPDIKVGLLSPNDCVMVIGIVRLVVVFAVIPLVDTFGRKPLLMISCGGCGTSMLAAAVWFFFNRNAQDYVFPWIPFASFLVYACFFNIGIGTLASTIQSELFPSHLKSFASALTAIILACTSAIVNALYLPVEKHLGMYVNYLIYALTCFLSLIFIGVVLFETKNKSLHEIQLLLQNQGREDPPM